MDRGSCGRILFSRVILRRELKGRVAVHTRFRTDSQHPEQSGEQKLVWDFVVFVQWLSFAKEVIGAGILFPKIGHACMLMIHQFVGSDVPFS